ncbi:hypothetical protein BU15DRAFT_86519 [Melanogaster broomeanus]|nr:hypothetical protein BU15DRAFT_86519 [Melanogaster broomeanus]
MHQITIQKRPREEAVVTQRKFFKKTARGKVIKVIRERYLRDDVYCGIGDCRACTGAVGTVLPSSGDLSHKHFPNGHYVLPDTNIFLSQMDLIESSFFSPPIILLQTVMEEVRHRSLPLYNRLKALLKMDDKKVWVFYNEFRSETAIVREEDETPNDRNDRGIRKGAEWYNTHLSLARPPTRGQKPNRIPQVILVTDDAANRQKAEIENLPCVSIRKYVEGMKDANQLLDLLSATGSEDIEPTKSVTARKSLYDEYLPTAMLLAGVKAGELHQGHFTANQYNYLEGTVSPVLLVGRENMNRAVHGDVVVVQVFNESEWKAPADEVVDQEATLKNDDAKDSGDEDDDETDFHLRAEAKALRSDEQKKVSVAEKQPTGRVVGIIKRNWRAYVCHVDPTSLPSTVATSLSTQTVFALPLSRLLPRIRLRTRQAPNLISQKILVTIDRWDPHSRYPEGHFVRALGMAEDKETEQESLLLEYEVPYRPFGKAILDCLPPEGDQWVVPPKSDSDPVWRDRLDLRELDICSIDPPGCQDIDDALHARRLPNGNIEAGVHIADVSHFVHPDTPMDNEAAARGTTVYLVDKRIDMLPSLLGTNLCSLRPHVERLAFSAIWELTEDAEIVNVRFTKSVIASKAAFEYEEAQMRKDDTNQTDSITQSILKAKRMAAGALNLASPEVKIHLASAESSDPIDVEQKELRETNSLVEEFMLLANVSVAKRIEEVFPQTAILRRHLPPPKTNFEKLQDILMKRKGFKLDVSSSGALADSLDDCVDTTAPAFNTLVRIMATRCMLSAEYFCSGSVSRDTFGHYGLASPIYTHFTSPIRRYADVLAHRQLAASISHTPLHASLHSKAHVERVMDVINRRHRMAQMAGRASVEFYVGLALKGKAEAVAKAQAVAGKMGRTEGEVGVIEDAFVIRTFRNGVGVFVFQLGLEGLVTFKRDVQFDAENYTLTVPSLSSAGVTISVFDKVKVRIDVEKDKNTQRAGPVDSRGL